MFWQWTGFAVSLEAHLGMCIIDRQAQRSVTPAIDTYHWGKNFEYLNDHDCIFFFLDQFTSESNSKRFPCSPCFTCEAVTHHWFGHWLTMTRQRCQIVGQITYLNLNSVQSTHCQMISNESVIMLFGSMLFSLRNNLVALPPKSCGSLHVLALLGHLFFFISNGIFVWINKAGPPCLATLPSWQSTK